MALPSQICLAVSIPGPVGPAGLPGTPGTNGISASTFLTASFVMPGQLASVTVAVIDSSVFSFGEIVYVAVAGYMMVVGIPDGTHLSLLNPRDDSSGGGGGGGGGGKAEVFFGSGDPNGVQTATMPAIFYTAAGEVWVKTVAGTTNTDWMEVIA